MFTPAKSILFVLGVILFSLAVISEKQMPASSTALELDSPNDWIKENQISVYSNRVVLNIKDATWASFTNTNSMDPVIDTGANALEILPKTANDIKVGDIISYQSSYGVIIHRVIEKGADKDGMYYVVKGDNNPAQDPNKVRFKDVKGVVVAVIY